MNDLKFAFRQLLKNPGFTAVAVLTLALGIGANTAIFSFVNTILLRPLPFMEPERLVMVYTSYQANDSHKNWVAAPTLNEWRKQSTVFEGLAARSFDGFVLTGRGQPENISGSRLSANIFRLLGIRPVLGGGFHPEEESYGKDHVVLQGSNFALAGELNESPRGSSAGRQRQQYRAVLVVCEVALSVMLLIGAGLMIRSFERLVSQELGYNPAHVVSLDMGLPGKKYPTLADQARFFDRLKAQVETLPGVQSVGLVRGLPLSGQNVGMSIGIQGAPPPAPGEPWDADYAQVRPGYFRTRR